MAVGDDFLSAEVRAECERIIPAVEDVKPEDAAETYLFLRANYGVHLSLTDDEMLNSVLAQ
jgi:hypothetical protein